MKYGCSRINLPFGYTASRIYRTLDSLKENGIIVPHKVGTQIFYKVNLTQKFTVLKEVINSTLSVLSKIEESCEFDESLLEEKKDLQI